MNRSSYEFEPHNLCTLYSVQSLTFVSGIAKKAVMSVRLQKPEYMRKAPPSPERKSVRRWNNINV